MFGGNNSNYQFFPNHLEEKSYQFNSNGPLNLNTASWLNPTPNAPLQLFGNEIANCNMNSSNYLGFNQPDPSKRVPIPVSNTDNLFDLSLNNNFNNNNNNNNINNNNSDWASCGLVLGLQNPNPNPVRVSTGLKLACDEYDYNNNNNNYCDYNYNNNNSYASSSTAGTSREMFNFFDDLRADIARQDQEIDLLTRMQEKELYRGYLELKNRLTASFANSIKQKLEDRIREKDLELDAINAKNRDLIEKLQQAASEAQQWQFRALQSDSLVNSLQEQLTHAVDLNLNGQPFEQCGENDAESSCVADRVAGQTGRLGKCRKCGRNEAGTLLIPCRHLALCEWCERNESYCPVCSAHKAYGVKVNFC